MGKLSKGYNPKQPRDENGRWTGGEVVSVSGGELGEFAETKELRKAAMQYARDNFVGKSYVNESSGHEIIAAKSGVKHTIANSGDELLKTVPYIPELIRKSKLVKTEPDKNGDVNISNVEIYRATVGSNGKRKGVIMVVKHYKDGSRRYYDHGFERK